MFRRIQKCPHGNYDGPCVICDHEIPRMTVVEVKTHDVIYGEVHLPGTVQRYDPSSDSYLVTLFVVDKLTNKYQEHTWNLDPDEIVKVCFTI